MGRWRPPAPASSPYITRAGFEALQAQLQELWLRRREVVAALSAAAAEGDRSENAEYIYRKKELGGIDRRIRYLQKRMPNLKVVDPQNRSDKVFFGAWVMLEQADGSRVEYRIVGPDETDMAADYISMDAPLARALLRKCLDDEVQLQLEERRDTFVIVGIRYE